LSILKIIGIILAIIIVLGLGVWLFSYTGNSTTETMKPAGTVTGKALIVYDPGLSGATKNAALSMASDLKAKGYEVKVAGVKSSNVSNVSGYDILIVGSPTYGGNPTGAIKTYLQGLSPPNNLKIGVYATGGSAGGLGANQEMASILQNKSITVKASQKFGPSSSQSEYSNFVAQILA
jgi:flavorubredoxin